MMRLLWSGVFAMLVVGCASAGERAAAQRGNGAPYEIIGSQVWKVPDPVSGRDYQVFVQLPASYEKEPARRYPVLYVTDADYAFPVLRQVGRRLGSSVQEFILVGVSYAVGEEGMPSRRRDYTPTANGAEGAPEDAEHGGGAAHAAYLRDQVLPYVAQRFRTDETQRLFLGHSYGALLGTQILLSEPSLFSGYVLGSPSYWFDQHVMERMEKASAATLKDMPAKVYFYIGEYEAKRVGDPRYLQDDDMVEDARRMERTLRGRGYPSLVMRLDVLNDEDHLSIAPRGFTQGLRYLLPGKSAP
jgi:hypothetical protein